MSDIRHPPPRNAHIRFTKWNGSLHWHFDAELLTRDEHGTWMLVPPGGTYRRGAEPPRTDEFGFVVLVPETAWWTASFNAAPRGANRHLIYVDINTAAVWDGDTATMIDLDLDVTVSPGSGARVIDEDEFDEHRQRWSYPPGVVDRARTTAARIAAEIDLGREPFGRIGPGRVARSLGWTRAIAVAPGADGQLRLSMAHPVATPVDGPLPGRLAVDGEIHQVTVTVHEQTVVDLRAPGLTGVATGTQVSMWVDPARATFDVA